MTLVSVVVPVYYNAATLPLLLHRLRGVAGELPGLDFEFMFVDDGSRDNSFAVVHAEAAADDRVRVLRLSRNFGSNAAILAGLNYARGDCSVVIAADLQDPPELIPALVQKWQGGADIVLAVRHSRDDPFVTRAFAAIFNRSFRGLVFPDFPPNGFDFALVSRRVAGQIVAMNERNSYIFGQIMWVGFEREIVQYDRTRREEGESRWTLTRKMKYFIDAFTAFSYLPIRAVTLVGVLVALAGFMWAAFVATARALGWIQEAGFAAVMVAVLILSGTQLIVSGLIGEYLWRVLEETRRRPTFLIAQTTNIDHPAHHAADLTSRPAPELPNGGLWAGAPPPFSDDAPLPDDGGGATL